MKIRKIPGRSRAAVRRVAAYCRVSTARGDQEDSYALQKETYERMIRSHPAWICAGIYADGGRSGLRAECRPEFQRLMTDARAGRIDLILVKSISRFARNIKECIETIRRLRQLGISVCFEKEGLNTLDERADLLLLAELSPSALLHKPPDALRGAVHQGRLRQISVFVKIFFHYSSPLFFFCYRKEAAAPAGYGIALPNRPHGCDSPLIYHLS